MGYNYTSEFKKFEKEWEQDAKYYAEHGIKLYIFVWEGYSNESHYKLNPFAAHGPASFLQFAV